MIKEFQGKYRFLSNFWPVEVILDGKEYPSVEHAYQAAKTLDPKERERIRKLPSPGMAKRAGRRVTMWSAWNDFKLSVMKDLVRQKFKDSVLRRQLLDTGQEYLQEGNRWGDKFWGVDLRSGEGQNHMGRILMKVREEVK